MISRRREAVKQRCGRWHVPITAQHCVQEPLHDGGGVARSDCANNPDVERESGPTEEPSDCRRIGEVEMPGVEKLGSCIAVPASRSRRSSHQPESRQPSSTFATTRRSRWQRPASASSSAPRPTAAPPSPNSRPSPPGRGASGNLVAICRSAGRPVTPATPQCERRSEGRPWDVPSRTVLLGDNDEVGGSAPSGGLVTRAAIRVERRPVHQRGRWRKLLRRPRCPARGGLREIRNRRAHPRPLRRRVGHATHRHAVRPALAARPRRRNPRGLAERNGPEQRPWRHLSPTIRSCPDQRSSA